MKRRKSMRIRIIAAAIAVVLVAMAVVLVVVLSNKKEAGTLAEASVVRASLSSNLSSTGLIKNLEFETDVPVAAFVLQDAETLGEIEENDYTVSLITLLGSGSQGPILYRVSDVKERMVGKESEFNTNDESVDIVTLVPLYFNWAAAEEDYRDEVGQGTTEAQSVKEYVLTLLLREGFSDIDPTAFPDKYWKEGDTAVTISTARIGEMILTELEHVDQVDFTISKLVCEKGDVLLLDSKIFKVTYSEPYVSFSLSEYDVAGIHGRMQSGERVYASVSINALSGRTLVAEILKIEEGKSVSGVSYFTLLGRLVFAEAVKAADGTTHDSYLYYDEFLTDSTVSYLGVDLSDALTREDVLENYSVTVSAQKTVVENTLIVPTKCIYYDDAKRPYVAVLDAEKKEKRVYIKITLSTGVDAAVVAADGYTLNEGDVLRYIADAGLISSLF